MPIFINRSYEISGYFWTNCCHPSLPLHSPCESTDIRYIDFPILIFYELTFNWIAKSDIGIDDLFVIPNSMIILPFLTIKINKKIIINTF